MCLIEAVLVYDSRSPGGTGPIPIGRTSNPEVLLMIRSQLLDEATREVGYWEDVDAGVAGMKAAEARRLEEILDLLLPEGGPAVLSVLPSRT